MNESQAYAILLTLIRARHTEINNSASAFLRVLGEENLHQKRATAQNLLEKIRAIVPYIAEHELPKWIGECNDLLTKLIQGNANPGDVLLEFIPLLNQIQAQEWHRDSRDQNALDFEAVFEEYRKTSRLPELFDEAINILEQIQQSDQVDSRAMLAALSRIVSTLKFSRDSTYFSLRGAWGFLVTFLQNYLWSEFEKIPGLGSAVEALRKTIDDMGTEIAVMNHEIKEKLDAKIMTEIKGASGITEMGFLTYNSKGVLERNNHSA